MEFPTLTAPKRRSLHRNSSVPLFDFSPLLDSLETAKDSDSLYQKRIKAMELRRSSLGLLSHLPKVAVRMPTFEMEERLLAHPMNAKYIVDVGFRYAEHEVSKTYALLLLEKGRLITEEPGGHKYWRVLGNLHYHAMQRYRWFHPCGIFHLHQATKTYEKALTYTENRNDVVLLMQYAFAQFMEGVKEKSFEMLQTINLHHGIPMEKTLSQVYIDRLFMYFQVCAANTRWHEAELTIRKMTLHPPSGYSTLDIETMLARCLQMQGDYLSSTKMYSQVLSKKFGPVANYGDEVYENLWHQLATVCLKYGHLHLAIEYLTLTLTYAKQTKTRAKLYYERGLAHYCLGNVNTAEDDYRRGRNSNHDIKPSLALVELKKSYRSEFNLLVNKPINEIIACVRKRMGRTSACLKLQRTFRKYLERKRGAEDPQQLTRKLLFVKQKTAKLIQVSPTIKSQTEAPPNDAKDEIVHRKEKEQFEAKRLETLASLEVLHNAKVELKPFLPNCHPRQYKALGQLPRSPPVNFLTPDFDRPDHRRKRSLMSYRRLGYSNGDVSYIQHWRALLKVGLQLYPTASSLSKSIVQIKAFHTQIPNAIAICALVESNGNVFEACGKLTDEQYYTELQSVVDVIDIECICAAQWSPRSQASVYTFKEETQAFLHGIPEVDPATGRFLVHDVRDIINRRKAPQDQMQSFNAKTKQISCHISTPSKKQGSFHISRIINDQMTRDFSAKDLLPLANSPIPWNAHANDKQ